MDIKKYCEQISEQGGYIGEDWHLRDKDGTILSSIDTLGIWQTHLIIDGVEVVIPEHYIIWAMIVGNTEKDIIHKGDNASDNNIDNLTIVEKSEEEERYEFPATLSEALKLNAKHSKWDKESVLKLSEKYDKHLLSIDAGVKAKYLGVYECIVDYTRNKALSKDEEIKDYALGLSGEVGEVNDLIKKMYYHKKEVNPIKILYELGDVLYYVTALGACFGFDLQTIATNNNVKLLSRYPKGFNAKDSNERIEDKR